MMYVPEVVEKVSEKANVLVEDEGIVKRLPKDKVVSDVYELKLSESDILESGVKELSQYSWYSWIMMNNTHYDEILKALEENKRILLSVNTDDLDIKVKVYATGFAIEKGYSSVAGEKYFDSDCICISFADTAMHIANTITTIRVYIPKDPTANAPG